MAEHPQRSSVLVFGLIIGLCVLALLAAIGVAVLIFSERFASAASPWVSPLATIRAGSINPAVALASLADEEDQLVVERAIAIGTADTALATLLYSTTLNDQGRAAGLLTLAHRLAQDGKRDQALLLARTAIDVAILSPLLPDYNRASALAHAGQVLAGMGNKDEALHAFTTAGTIAEHSRRLDPTYRLLLLEGLIGDLSRLGYRNQAQALRASMAAEPPRADASPQILPALLVPLEPTDDGAWMEMEEARQERVALVKALIASLTGASPTPPETIRRFVETALLREDRLRQEIYTTGISDGANLLQRVALARARVDWLTLKWRVARQGFGIVLVPPWENQVADIEADLYRAYQDYFLILRDAAVSLPELPQAAQGDVEAIQDQIKWGRLGLPPSAREGELVRALDRSSRECIALGLGHLYITIRTDKETIQFAVATVR